MRGAGVRVAITVAVGIGLTAATVPAAENKCMYAGEFFSPGAVSCQDGTQYRCDDDDGSWRRVGLGCADTEPGADEPDIHVRPSRDVPAVEQPPPPVVPQD